MNAVPSYIVRIMNIILFTVLHVFVIFLQIVTTKSENYPITPPIAVDNGLKYRIALISDLDTNSRISSASWIAYLKKGYLYLNFNKQDAKLSKVAIEWDSGEPQIIESNVNKNGRGMELSELISFNGQILTCDDRTGVVFSINIKPNDSSIIHPSPWVVLNDGNGKSDNGFKCEWGTVKNGELWIGGLGKEWVNTEGEVVDHNQMFVKVVCPSGGITHLDWKHNYIRMSDAAHIHFPGYIEYEAGGWSEIYKRWMFLPRHASKHHYNEKTKEKMGANIMTIADEKFNKVEIRHIGDTIPTHGFSSFKWIPGTLDQLIVALKSVEYNNKTATYIMIFSIDGHILLPETKAGDCKYEGVEFI